MPEHNYEYFRLTYGVPAKRGAPVRFNGRPGKVTGTRGPYLLIKFEDEKRSKIYHPTWGGMEWLERSLTPQSPGGVARYKNHHIGKAAPCTLDVGAQWENNR